MKQFRLETKEQEVMGKTQYFAKMYRMTPKGRSNEAIEFNYRFSTSAARDQYIATFYANQAAREARSVERKNAKSEARKNMVNPFKVGDILYDSWGYEQTNIDFYQVVEVGAKSVKIRPLAQNQIIKEGYSSMSEFVTPMVDVFTGPAETHILQMYLNSVTGEPVVYVTSRHGSISKYDGQEKYQSHYA